MELSKRIQALKTSPTRKLNPYAEESEKKELKFIILI